MNSKITVYQCLVGIPYLYLDSTVCYLEFSNVYIRTACKTISLWTNSTVTLVFPDSWHYYQQLQKESEARKWTLTWRGTTLCKGDCHSQVIFAFTLAFCEEGFDKLIRLSFLFPHCFFRWDSDQLWQASSKPALKVLWHLD